MLQALQDNAPDEIRISTMTLEMTGAPARSAEGSLWSKFVALLSNFRRAQTRESTLAYLSELDDIRLYDLGLTRADVRDASKAGTTEMLNARRVRNVVSHARRSGE